MTSATDNRTTETATSSIIATLRERGVQFVTYGNADRVWWTAENGVTWYAQDRPNANELFVKLEAVLTPDQAIAATLGSEREAELQKALNKAAGNWAKADAELRKALDFMRIWISEDAHLGESAYSRELEEAEGLRKLDTIEQAIAATLGSGTCHIESSYLNDFTSNHECWYEFEMQCGYRFTWDEMEPPNFCPNCGKEVER